MLRWIVDYICGDGRTIVDGGCHSNETGGRRMSVFVRCLYACQFSSNAC